MVRGMIYAMNGPHLVQIVHGINGQWYQNCCNLAMRQTSEQ